MNNRRMSDREGRLTLNIPEVARRLGIGKNQAYALARAGVLPAIKLGKRYLVPVHALERWLEEQTSKGSGAGDAA